MRSATLLHPREFEIQSFEDPEPGPGQVLVHIHGCGVCGSDMGPWKGIEGLVYPMVPGAPGHEVFGTIAGLGEGVDGFAVGEPVTALTYRGYAEYDVAEAGSLVRLPPALARRPVLGEPLACSVNVARRAGVVEGDLVVLLGAGFLGGLLVQLLQHDRQAKPGRIVAVSRRRAGLDAALRLGVDETLTYDDDVRGRISELSGGKGADVVIEATGRQGPLDLAAELTRVRGRLIVAGYHQDGTRTVNMQLWNWRGIDVINAHERDPEVYRRGMEEGVARLAAGEVDLDALLTHRFPLAEINRAFGTAEARPEGFLKSLVLTGEDGR